jgi:PBP1b-binding outer membrane lipoprotein LpoB
MKKILSILFLSLLGAAAFSQQAPEDANVSPALSKAFENDDPQLELQRLQGKKNQLEIRLTELKNSAQSDSTEINRVEGLIKYLDVKIEAVENYLSSVEYAKQNGMPEQGTMTDEEFQIKFQEWKNQQAEIENKQEGEVKTSLTREEFNKLPKERQDRILSMPDRYTIID